MKKRTKQVLVILKPKSKALGFSREELEGIAADVANNLELDEEASDEDVNAEIEKQEKDLQHLQQFLAGVQKKLANANFVAHAPEAVVAKERKKQSDAEEKIAALEESLKALKAKK